MPTKKVPFPKETRAVNVARACKIIGILYLIFSCFSNKKLVSLFKKNVYNLNFDLESYIDIKYVVQEIKN